MGLRETLDEPVSNYITGGFVRVGASDTVTRAARAMQESGATEALVFDGKTPVGIVTERDILYKVVAAGSDPSGTMVRAVMSSPVQTVEDTAKVGEAIAKMSKLGLRRLGVTKEGVLVGIVTQKAVVSGSSGQHVVLPELVSPGRLTCPYCDATMKDKDELSKHIDQVHLGPGLLEGDRRKW
jgi:CBS domain-containing protein